MSDIHCRVCGEPWDAYGARHGDMLHWEYELFRRGAGCPECMGEEPKDYTEDDKLEALRHDMLIEPSDDEVMGEAQIDECMGTLERLAWKRPEPKAIWTCAGCGVSVGKDVDDPSEMVWFGGERVHHQGSTFAYSYDELYRAGRPDEEPEATIDGKPYCPGCVSWCEGDLTTEGDGLEDTCAGAILQGYAAEGLDTYDPGANFTHDYKVMCLACYEHALDKDRRCEHCDELDCEGECCCPECGEHTGGGLCKDCCDALEEDAYEARRDEAYEAGLAAGTLWHREDSE